MEVNADILKTIINTIYEWLVLVDKDANIVMINDAYCEFLGVNRENVIGKPVQDVIENTRMHIVAQTGQEELADIQNIKGNDMIANRFPIKIDEEIVGALGSVMFRTTNELKAVSEKIHRLSMELEYYKTELGRESSAKYGFEQIIGESSKMKEVKNLAKKAANSQSTVLILGESGTGKELFAHAIHKASSRSQKPFIRINCAAIPDNLLESELFGYAEGAFTGAKKGGKPGKFELAHEGTIFLDEIGDMPMNMQTKLLRVLQEMEVERIGGTKTISIDVRVIAATNAKVEKLFETGQFRQDLYYRLNVIRLDIPSLAERKEDIPLISYELLKKLNYVMGQTITTIDPETMELLMAYHWPGNIRELENILERALNVVEYSTIQKEHLPYYLKASVDNPVSSKTSLHLKQIVEQVEKDAIEHAISVTENRVEAAKLLGISKTTLYDKIQKYFKED